MSLTVFLVIVLLGSVGCSTDVSLNESDLMSNGDVRVDPLEPVNRFIFSINDSIDQVVIGPLARSYNQLDAGIKKSVHNFTTNLRAPILFVNQILQNDRKRAGLTLGRFMINSTLGVLGIFDFADLVGCEVGNEEDIATQAGNNFGITLRKWGVGRGPYLVLPILGPSSARDALGKIADVLMDPLHICCFDTIESGLSSGANTFLGRAENEEEIEKMRGGDFYAELRDAYLSHRNYVFDNLVDWPETLPPRCGPSKTRRLARTVQSWRLPAAQPFRSFER